MEGLLFVNILVIIVTAGISIHAFGNEIFKGKWMHKPYRVKENKEWYRLVSSGFVHADWMHLIFNMLSLFFFGGRVVGFFIGLGGLAGILFYLLFYLSAIVVSSLPDQRKYANSRGYSSLGASGAVSAVIFAGILLDPLTGIHIFPFSLLFDKGIPGFIFAPLYLWYCSYMSKQNLDNINHDAHYYGAIYGVLAIILLEPSSVTYFVDQVLSWRIF